jgi:thiamine-monophosphate kinase
MSEPRRTLADVGEVALVERIFEILGVGERGAPGAAAGNVLVGPGDDAAVLACHDSIVLTTDSQHEDVHFRREWTSAEMLGRRAIAVNASDIGAMGARPTGFLVALALPKETRLEWVEELALGMRQGAERAGAVIVGGDVAAVPGKVSINVTAVGECDAAETVRRGGARAGDHIYVTGRPGRAAAGRRLLLAGHRLASEAAVNARDVPATPADKEKTASAPAVTSVVDECLLAFLDPTPPVAFGGEVARRGLVSAMMDVSDGLGIDLGRLCRASNTGAALRADLLLDDPVLQRVATDFGIDARACVLGGGDDYELLCAVSETDAADFRAAAASCGIEVRSIGAFVDGEARVALQIDGHQEPLSEGGWDHFST